MIKAAAKGTVPTKDGAHHQRAPMDNKSPDENSRHTPGACFARHEWNAPPNPRKKS